MCKCFQFWRIRGDIHIRKSTPSIKLLRGVAVITLEDSFFNHSNLSSCEVRYYTPLDEFLQDSLFKGQGSLLNFHDQLLGSNSDSS